jgi:hypothetical protein
MNFDQPHPSWAECLCAGIDRYHELRKRALSNVAETPDHPPTNPSEGDPGSAMIKGAFDAMQSGNLAACASILETRHWRDKDIGKRQPARRAKPSIRLPPGSVVLWKRLSEAEQERKDMLQARLERMKERINAQLAAGGPRSWQTMETSHERTR